MSKKVLLARPNPFIVNQMRGFISDCNFTPTPIHDLEQLGRHDEKDVAGIVISTAVNSSVKESFNETLQTVIETFPKLPIVIATLVQADKIKRTTDAFLNDLNLKYVLKSIENVNKTELNHVDDTMMILEKSLITDKSQYAHSREVVMRYFG